MYIIKNDAMPDILKIGYSTKDPILRAKELAGTGSPHPYHVLFDVLVEEPRSVEQAVHVLLALKREGKEWFRCSHSEAVSAIRSCAKIILIERNNLTVEHISASEKLFEFRDSEYCYYYDCKKLSTQTYKGTRYCDEHNNIMRKFRFDFARKIRNG